MPPEVRTERNWERDGLVGEEVSWSAGFGPRTSAWVLKPARASGPLPAVLALHGHDSFKYYGKEKVADGPDEAAPGIQHLREEHYEGRAFANELAWKGFVVLAHDVFLWGSRRFSPQEMPVSVKRIVEDYRVAGGRAGRKPGEIEPTTWRSGITSISLPNTAHSWGLRFPASSRARTGGRSAICALART